MWRLPFFGDGGGGEERGVTQVVSHHDGRVQRREIQRRDRRVVVTERQEIKSYLVLNMNVNIKNTKIICLWD